MKLNFWQILGLILLAISIVGLVYKYSNKSASTTPTTQTP